MKNHGIPNGIFYGVASIIVTLGFYLGGPSLFCKWWLALLVGLVVAIIFMVRAGRATKDDLGGYINFKQAIKPTFSVAVVGLLISSLFTYIMYNFIDSNLDQLVRECALEMTTNFMERMGASAEDIDEALIRIEQEDYSMTPVRVLKQYAYGLIAYFILAAIISLIIRKKNPEEV